MVNDWRAARRRLPRKDPLPPREVTQAGTDCADGHVVRDLLLLLFWTWLASSLFIYVRRLLGNGSLRSQSRGSDSTSNDARPSRSSRTKHAPRLSIDEELAAMAPPPLSAIDASTATNELGLDTTAGTTRTDDYSNRDAPLARSLAEALAGIKIPCDLAPMVTTEHLDPRNMLFATTDHPAEVIGTSVADELERLGYSLVPIDSQTIHARHGGTLLEITVHPDKVTASGALAGRAAAAPDAAVLVEFQLR